MKASINEKFLLLILNDSENLSEDEWENVSRLLGRRNPIKNYKLKFTLEEIKADNLEKINLLSKYQKYIDWDCIYYPFMIIVAQELNITAAEVCNSQQLANYAFKYVEDYCTKPNDWEKVRQKLNTKNPYNYNLINK